MEENSVQILLVENDQIHVELIKRAFVSLSNRFDIKLVGSLEEAKFFLAKSKPGLVIVDFSLPDGQGTDLLSESYQDLCDFPIIILTGQGDEQVAVEAIKAGALDYIVKSPDSLSNLPNVAEHALREWRHIVARRYVEAQLRFQAEILDSVRESVVVTDLEGSVLYWSKGAEALYGYLAEEVMGQPISFTVGPSESHEIEKRLQKVRETGSWSGQYAQKRKDGSLFWADTFISIATDEFGKPFGMIGIDRDITNRVNTEEALREANQELTLVVRTLQRRNRQITLLNEMGDLLQSCLSVSDAYSVLGEYAEKLFPELSGAMYILTQSRNLLEVVSSWGKNPPEVKVFESDACWAMRRVRTHSVTNAHTRVKCQHIISSRTESSFSPYLCAPMTAHGESLGLLHLVAPPNEDIVEWQQLSTTVAERAALAISNLKLREELRLQSILDPLTGLFNRRYFEKMLEREVSRAKRHERPVGVFMLDVDDLKGYNDQFGHAVGDALLHEIGFYLKKHVRGEDVACRFGGDEFMIVLPDASLSNAQTRAEELCAGIKDLCILFQDKKLEGSSVSIGVACFPMHGTSAEQILKAADSALYAAKEAGQNCVRTAST